MASEYEIREVGFIGSLWRGKTDSPKNVGKTFEVRLLTSESQPLLTPSLTSSVGNLPRRFLGSNTVQRIPNASIGGKTKLYFTDETDLDINLLKKNLSDSDFYFEFGFLTGATSNDFLIQMRVDPTFFVNKKILFRYNKNQLKEITYSKIPIQTNWSFETTDELNIRYLNKLDFESTYAEFVIVLSYSEIQNLKNAFTNNRLLSNTSQIQQTSLFESPTFDINIRGDLNLDRILYPKTDPLQDRLPEQPVLTDSVNFTIDGAPRIEVFPAKPTITEIFSIPVNNDEETARERAGNLFALNKQFYTITDINEFNSRLSEVNEKIKRATSVISSNSTITGLNPFDKNSVFRAKVSIIFNNYVKNYLYEQICIIEDVDIPEREPDRWNIDENGIVTITPRSPVLPTELVNKAVEDRKNLDEFDSYIDDLIDDLTLDDNNVYVFKKVSRVADYSLPILRYKTKGLFRCTGEKLSTFHTGSLTDKQQKYYLTVFNEKQYTDESYHQFDITYCHISGSGSSHIEGEVDLYPAKAMYRKYMLECYGHTNGKFPFKNGKNGDYFYVIQLDRNQFKEKLDLGNFELALCELSSSGTQTHQTSNRFFTLIDESKDSKQEIVTNEGIQEYYYVTSGSIRDGVYGEPEDDAWGIVFPKMGLIILDGVILDQSCSFNTITGSADGQNSKRLFLSISGAAVPTPYRPSGSFFARSFETYLTETYFCRADFNEFNNSTNYTYTSGSNGYLKYDYFAKEPQSFITTVGLYNKQKELLAVGKLRKPIRKNDGKVCIFEVVLRLN